jgi:alpha 1,3-glucosidase
MFFLNVCLCRTMWMHYPKTEALFDIDDQYLIGSDLLVKPVTAPGVVESVVKFPTDDVWYDAESLVKVSGKGIANDLVEITVPSDIDTIPVFQRGGSVIVRKLRLRRSSRMMMKDPYTLYIALSDAKTASGVLYMDDEETFGHATKEEYAEAKFIVDFAAGTIQNEVTVGAGWVDMADSIAKDRMVERIVVMGVESSPKSISVNGESVGFTFDSGSNVLVIRKPDVSALTDWELKAAF